MDTLDAHIDSVHLTISSLDRSLRFYEERVGLQSRWRDESSAGLGTGAGDLLVLHEAPDAPQVRGTTGLYHFALLVPSRADLARSLRHLAETHTPLQGFSDHLVSEAIYLADPDGNGIEIYRDRPRDEWPRHRGQLRMASEPLDVENLVAEAAGDTNFAGLAPGTIIGHIHLQVSQLAPAEDFYARAIGFDLIQHFSDTAAFLSSRGYHHHVAVNTWAGLGAPQPPPNAVGLRYFVIGVPDADALDGVAARLRRATVPHDGDSQQIAVTDPSGNHMVIAIRAA